MIMLMVVLIKLLADDSEKLIMETAKRDAMLIFKKLCKVNLKKKFQNTFLLT